jgi:asparagine synthase (glutamine-hydrolysing)
MCGIAGVVTAPGSYIDPRKIPAMLQLLEHRGPDDAGYLWFSQEGIERGRQWNVTRPVDGTVLLHRRLSILDLGDTGWQPISTTDGRYHMVFNGEVYNFVEIRGELEAIGYTFRSTSDSEVVLAAYAEWGAAALKRFVGMFALAILDTFTRTMFLARDFFGIKPLYYTCVGDSLAFASEIKSLLELSGCTRKANPERLYMYMRYGATDQGGETMFADILQLPAAHFMELSIDNPRNARLVRYWDVDLSQRLDISFDEAADHLRELFLESVKLHLRSDVPVGAALSGGIDSSAVVMAMRHVQGANLDLHTFSFVADDPSVSEERWMDIVGKAAGATMHKVSPSSDEMTADLERLAYHQDEPFGSTSLYAQYRVMRLVREAGIKVILDGQGADEILGGYRFFSAARLASLVRQFRWGEAIQFLSKVSRLPGMNTAWMVARTADYLVPLELQEPLRRLIGKDLAPSWMNAQWFEQHGVTPRWARSNSSREALREDMRNSVTKFGLAHLLRYEDRNSMAYSIESRVPFLTPQLVNFMLSLPEEYIISPDGTSKAVFRKAMRGIVPDVILDRKDKIGFVTPEKKWLRQVQAWGDRMLRLDTVQHIPALNVQELLLEWQQVMSGQKSFDSRVWRWLNLIDWTRQFDVVYE